MRISVHELIGSYAIAAQDGDLIFAHLRDALAKGKPVVLDFTQVKVVTPSFLNPAVGRLLSEFNAKQVREAIQPCNLPDHAERLWDRVIIDSEAYFSLSPEEQDRIDEIVANAIMDR